MDEWYWGTELEDQGFFEAQSRLLDRSNETTPSPWNYRSGFFSINTEQSCACESLESLIEWFGIDLIREWMERFGFVVASYEVPDNRCWVGNFGQVLFAHRYASRVQEEVLSD